MAKKLFLIPNTLSEEIVLSTIPSYIPETIAHLRIFLVEEGKNARRFLKKVLPQIPLQECQFYPLNEHTSSQEIAQYLEQSQGNDMGIISEAGCPCVADPGSELVLLAHQKSWQVIPLIGASSIMLALMASGLNGQQFAFHGYLPHDKELRKKKIREFERVSFQEKQTQIFMEPPYRNESLMSELLSLCDPRTLLCVAVDLTAPTETVRTLKIADWKKEKIDLRKRPALFLMQKQ